MSTYTDSSDIVFLNDKNIVHSLTADKVNAIASQTLVSGLSSTVAGTYVSAANAEMDNATADSLTVSTSLSAAAATANAASISSLTVDNLTANGEIQASALNISGAAGTVNVANVRASTMSAATISASEQIVVDGKLTATNDGLTANGKLSTSSNLIVAGNLSASANEMSAKGLTANDVGVRTNGLSATNVSASSLSATALSAASLSATSISASSLSATSLSATDLTAISGVFSPGGIRIGDNATTNKILIDNDELKIIVPLDNGDPKLNINGKRFTEYYEGYLSDGYLESVDIVIPATGTYTNMSCLQFTWNNDSGKGTKLIPLSALGGMYDEAGDIIKIIKTDANSFKVSADEDEIVSVIRQALSDELNELSSKVKYRVGDSTSAISSLTIRKINAQDYASLEQPAKELSDTIYVIDGDDMNMFNSKITNLHSPEADTDAATKGYVDTAIDELQAFSTTAAETLSGDLTALMSTTSAETCTSAAAYTDAVSTSLSTSLQGNIDEANNKIDSKIQLVSNVEPTKDVETLSIYKMTAASYKELTEEDKAISNVIYSITDADCNMFGSKIVELGAPTVSDDAATKDYVDTTVDAAKAALSGHLTFVDDSASSKMLLKLSGQDIAYFDYGPFIKDGMLENVEVSSDSSNIDVLVFTFNADNQSRIITVPLTSLAEVYSNGVYTTITPDGSTSHNTSIIDVNIAAVQNAIDSSIRSNIDETNLTVLHKHASTPGTWAAPASGSPLAQLSGAISTAVKVDAIAAAEAKDNTISTSLSGTISSTYVSADVLQQNATNGTGVFSTYAKKADYVSNDALSDPTNGILRKYYTIDQLEGNGGLSPALSSVYQLTANMANYSTTGAMNTAIANAIADYDNQTASNKFETISHVDNLIANLSAGASSLSNGIAVIADGALDGSNDLGILSAKINELVGAMNTIISALSSISKNAPAS